MEPLYVSNFWAGGIISKLESEVPWVNFQAARAESFMSHIPREYQYIENGPVYKSNNFHPIVSDIMAMINTRYGCDLNVCFLNYYSNDKKALGWHSDDSAFIDQSDPIAVVSFGVEREIWWKPIGFTGKIPDEWKQSLADGSLFIMPAGMQETHRHKIPKGDREMGARISLTYRKMR